MEALFTTDQSFFNITLVEQVGQATFLTNALNNMNNKNISHDVISIDINESHQVMTEGSISLYDPFSYYANILRLGTKFNLTWGYKTALENSAKLELLQDSPEEMTSSGIRQGLQCVVTNPSGAGDVNGNIVFNCNFYGVEFYASGKENKVFKDMTAKQVIEDRLKSLGCKETKVDFDGMNTQLNSNTYIRQQESTFKFLNRYAFEKRCLFKIGYKSNGQLTGLFISASKINSDDCKSWVRSVNGATGGSKLFQYGFGSSVANVMNYSWQFNVGNCGEGDGTQLSMIGGEVKVQSYLVDPQTAKGLSLNSEKLQKYVEEHADEEGMIKSAVIDANSLNHTLKDGVTKVRDFFDEIEMSTAPQGLGYSVSLSCVGDTTLTPLVLCKFGNGFPSQFTTENKDNAFYVAKVNHNISSSGYVCKVDIQDAITMFKGFVQ